MLDAGEALLLLSAGEGLCDGLYKGEPDEELPLRLLLLLLEGKELPFDGL